ncbi:MAG: DUF5050 domain-containing protein [Oscillospiraceae bacterium]|nr:DUF5050 domain-containing protein [Oscillospiraceae bacterium]
MKKYICLLIAALILLSVFAACGDSAGGDDSQSSDDFRTFPGGSNQRADNDQSSSREVRTRPNGTQPQRASATSQVSEVSQAPEQTAPVRDENRNGSTPGNLVNGGLFVQKDGWIYYSNPADGSSLYRMKTDGSNDTKMNDDPTSFINVLDGWVYYVAGVARFRELHKVRIDGSGFATVIQNSLIDYLNVVDDTIYYLTENQFYTFKINGKAPNMIFEEVGASLSNMFISGNFVYFHDGLEVGFYRKRTNSGVLPKSRIRNVELLRSADMAGEWLYFSNNGDMDKFYKIRVDGLQKTQIADFPVKCINIRDGWIYFANMANGIFKMREDGTEMTRLTADNPEIALYNISVLEDRLYYNDNYALFTVRTDGTGQQNFR